MYWTSFNVLIARYISPHWRATGRESLIKALCGSLEAVNDEFIGFRKESNLLVNVNSQTKILEFYLKKHFGVDSGITILDGDFIIYDFHVYISNYNELNDNDVIGVVEKYKTVGKRYTIITY